ncbi:putative quinol monooxygenase [Undibacterium rugosum]|uniref:putative quinol monooxygenase n=1 Tax=Undibacterium rugosum TaxID=2762291 RepID=UPI001B80EBD8|nr:antibiotic biosynthesis monooxygenase [Undibacterium rugosum]MBR7778913.1 antibiotic biosynthesis monooxygenase [Undibacterium rugosum]
MKKVALVVSISYHEEFKTAFLQALSEHQQRCLQTEAGTLQFELLQPDELSNTVMIFELYANQDVYQAHDQGSSLARFKEQAGAWITAVSVQQCLVM